jgi:hypothetical protein
MMSLSRTSHDLHSDAEMGTAVTASFGLSYLAGVALSGGGDPNGHHDDTPEALKGLRNDASAYALPKGVATLPASSQAPTISVVRINPPL